MGSFDLILAVLGLLIVGVAMVYTYMTGRQTDARPSEVDTEISEKVQDHYVLRNPIFLAYIVAAVLILAYIAYVALSTKW